MAMNAMATSYLLWLYLLLYAYCYECIWLLARPLCSRTSNGAAER